MSRKKLDELGVSAFCESMAMMIQAGIATDEAISLLQSDREIGSGVLEQGLAVMKTQVDEGRGLAAAMKESGIFPDYALQMTEAGESSGRLEDTLFRLAAYYKDQKTIAEKLHNAITYPAAMLVLPAFRDVYNSLTGSLSVSSYSYVRWAFVFCWAALILMVLIALALIVGLHFWNNGKRDQVERILRRNKTCAAILENMGMFRFTSALSIFLASGEMQDDAVLKSIPMAACEPVEEKLKRCARRMEEGHSFAQAAYDEELFEPIYGRMLLAGERSGNLENVLDRLTGLLEENCSNLVERLIGTVDPLLSGVLMVTVGLSLLSVMLPLIGMMNSIG